MRKTYHFKGLIEVDIDTYGNIYQNKSLLIPFINQNGYYETVIKYNNINYHLNNHLEIYKVFLKPTIPRGYVIHHKDNNKLNNEINNLILMSRKEQLIISAKLAADNITPEQLKILNEHPKLCRKCVAHIFKVSLATAKIIKLRAKG